MIFDEARPVRGATYFSEAGTCVNTATVVCLYNEEGFELKRTLEVRGVKHIQDPFSEVER